MHQHIKAMSLLSLFFSRFIGQSGRTSACRRGRRPIPLRWFYFVNGKSNAALLANYKNIDIFRLTFTGCKMTGPFAAPINPM